MKQHKQASIAITIGFFWTVLAGSPTLADDTDLFLGAVSGFTDPPNILLILDTSGSMDGELFTQGPFDPAVTYAGACTPDRIYWNNDATPPGCASDNYLNAEKFVCAAAQAPLAAAGIYRARFGVYDDAPPADRNTTQRWERLSSALHDNYVECEPDRGLHGDGTDGSALFARDGDPARRWSSDPAEEVEWRTAPLDRRSFVFSANYVNWYNTDSAVQTKMEIVKQVARDFVSTSSGVNVGLMRFNFDEGGRVISPIRDVGTGRPALISAINALEPDGFTPLSEVLYEAGLYFRGAAVDYGNQEPSPQNSVATSRIGPTGSPGYDQYQTPIMSECQKNFIVFLTDGLPTRDESAAAKILSQPGMAAVPVQGTCAAGENGSCLDDQAAYLFNADLIPDAVLPDHQSVTTYMVGFDYSDDPAIFRETAAAGGGEYFTADDTASLTSVLSNIVTSILETQTTFSAPSISVNTFNRTKNINDLYVALFSPGMTEHWDGNLKKYRLDPVTGDILDAAGRPAVDPDTGFFRESAQSYWSPMVDGDQVTVGGAAGQLPAPGARQVYTFLGVSSDLTAPSNALEVSNGLLDEAILGIGGPRDPARALLIDFARGADVDDVDGDGNTAESRKQLGDPLHAQPVSIIYGGTIADPDIDDALVIMPTNDGYLHAIDAGSGEELWTFIPPDLLPDLADLYRNEASADKHYGLDGTPVIQIFADDDGIIEQGEKVFLYFGMRRGGALYYGLDISDKNRPRLLWRKDENDLPGLGQSWSAPVPTRLLIDRGEGQNDEHSVLIFGGGYDPDQDDAIAGTDNIGNAVYIVDSQTGDLLWYHSGTEGTSATFPELRYSMPSDLKVIDIDSDGYADRIYAADMGGQIWRLDLFNGSPEGELVTGGVIASLGAAAVAEPTAALSRRFYYSPDAALVTTRGGPFIHLGIGSGHRASPNSFETMDRFYALRDYRPFIALSQADYSAIEPVTDSDPSLINVTGNLEAEVPAGAAGWYYDFAEAGRSGEKVLAEARTFNNQVFFTTFTPGVNASNPCSPVPGTNRLYVVDVVDGAPVNNLDESANELELTESDRFLEFNGSIASEVVFLFPSPDETDGQCVGNQCSPEPIACVDLFCFPPGFRNDPIRTFWSQENVQ